MQQVFMTTLGKQAPHGMPHLVAVKVGEGRHSLNQRHFLFVRHDIAFQLADKCLFMHGTRTTTSTHQLKTRCCKTSQHLVEHIKKAKLACNFLLSMTCTSFLVRQLTKSKVSKPCAGSLRGVGRKAIESKTIA
jgi:hypothetical protein